MPFDCQMRIINIFFSSFDSLTIYDGGSSTSLLMGKYCGDSIPSSHVSSSNEVLIQFQSDGSYTRAGFQMEYNPLGKQNISIQFKTTLTIIYVNRSRILGPLFISRYLYSFCRKMINIAKMRPSFTNIFSLTLKCRYYLKEIIMSLSAVHTL